MITGMTSIDDLYGATVTGQDGDKIGKVDEVYLDDRTGDPEWVSVKTGLFGSNVSLIPLDRATLSDGTVTVPFDKSKVKDAPNHDPGAHLSESDEQQLYDYYGLSYGTTGTTGRTDTTTTGTTGRTDTTTTTGRTDTTTTSTTGAAGVAGTAAAGTTGHARGEGHDTSGPNTDDAMTRSKEELHVGTEQREAGRARLRKHIVSTTESRTVPVAHEEVRVEREPITEANRGAALSGGDLTEEEHEVTLHEERPVVSKETKPVERVRLGTETVEGRETVEAEVREEKIDLDAGTETTTTDRDRR